MLSWLPGTRAPHNMQLVPLNTLDERFTALLNGSVDAVINSKPSCLLPEALPAVPTVLPALPAVMTSSPLPPLSLPLWYVELRSFPSPDLTPLAATPPLPLCRLPGITITPERRKLVQFVFPSYYSAGAALFAPGGAIDGVGSWEDLSGQTVALLEGSYILDAAPETPALQNVTLLQVPTAEGGVGGLVHGEVQHTLAPWCTWALLRMRG